MSTVSTREMNKNETEIFIMLSKASSKIAFNLFTDLCKEDGGWVLKAIEKRFDALGFVADKKVMVMVLIHGAGVVGKCANYVDDICKKSQEKGFVNITFEKYINDIYPHGVPVF